MMTPLSVCIAIQPDLPRQATSNIFFLFLVNMIILSICEGINQLRLVLLFCGITLIIIYILNASLTNMHFLTY